MCLIRFLNIWPEFIVGLEKNPRPILQDQDQDRKSGDQDQDHRSQDQDRDQDQNNYFTSDLKTISNENVLLMYADDANLVVSQKSKSSIYMFIGYFIIVLFEYYWYYIAC